MLTLYYWPGACSIASHIVLEEIGAAYEAVKVDFTTNEQRSGRYLAINSHGRVPALAMPDGVLTETAAILRYLADLRPDLRRLPTDTLARAQAQASMTWLASHLHVAIAHVSRWERYGDEAARPAMAQKARETAAAAFDQIEARLAGRAWTFGDYSVVDPYLLFFRRIGGLVADMGAYPNIRAHAQRVAERPAAARVLADEGVGLEDFGS